MTGATAQQVSSELAPSPLPASTLDAAVALMEGAQQGAPVQFTPITSSDDSVPLPIARQVSATAAGDQVTQAASGDPFFLGFAAGTYSPPAGESIDPLLLNCAALLRRRSPDERDLRLRDVPEDHAAADPGAEALGTACPNHLFYTLKVAMGERHQRHAANPAVHWVGVQRPARSTRCSRRSFQPIGSPAIDVHRRHDSDTNEFVSTPVGVMEEGGPNGAQVLTS